MSKPGLRAAPARSRGSRRRRTDRAAARVHDVLAQLGAPQCARRGLGIEGERFANANGRAYSRGVGRASTRTGPPEHVSSLNCRRPAAHCRTHAVGRPLRTEANMSGPNDHNERPPGFDVQQCPSCGSTAVQRLSIVETARVWLVCRRCDLRWSIADRRSPSVSAHEGLERRGPLFE